MMIVGAGCSALFVGLAWLISRASATSDVHRAGQGRGRSRPPHRDATDATGRGHTAELAKSLSLFNATLESTADGIFTMRFDSGVNCYNTKFRTCGVFARDDGARARPEIADFIAPQTKDPARFLARVQAVLAAPETRLRPDRAGRWPRVRALLPAQRVEGAIVGSWVNFRDITERKRAEAELKKVHQQLVDTSRQAGMAEVATGVLHNCGNVLNSVNVSRSSSWNSSPVEGRQPGQTHGHVAGARRRPRRFS